MWESEIGHWISEKIDEINLFMIKLLGTLLTVLTIIGYLESVSRFDHLLDIHIIVVAILFLVITMTGFSVYVYRLSGMLWLIFQLCKFCHRSCLIERSWSKGFLDLHERQTQSSEQSWRNGWELVDCGTQIYIFSQLFFILYSLTKIQNVDGG